ncbi:MAG: hypothetical protein A2X94_02380 [Bdellovibrionales bacterium GWB1_55_8]|nr:MAG: hypothetical protein A2X94_02380 [Bdellovibrionales bacterium GWB1_55_8]
MNGSLSAYIAHGAFTPMIRKAGLTAFIIALLISLPVVAPYCLGEPAAAQGRPPSLVFAKVANKSLTATYTELEELSAYAAAHGNNAFEFLRDISLHLAGQRATLRIHGHDLRRVAERFSLGNDVVRAILPLAHVNEIRIGRSTTGTPDIQVELNSDDVTTHFNFFGFFTVRLHFDEKYGINSVSGNRLGGIHGVIAERLGSTAAVLSVSLLGSTRIGVQLDPGPSPTVRIAPIQYRAMSNRAAK